MGKKDFHPRSSSKTEVNTKLDDGRKLSFGFFSPRNDRTNERIASLSRETRVVIGPFTTGVGMRIKHTSTMPLKLVPPQPRCWAL
jgi:hypothetical protein